MNVNGCGGKAKGVQNAQSLRAFIARMSDQIKTALPANFTPERMTRIALTAISRDEKLAMSTPDSFMGALLTAAQLGLECNTPLGQAYLIPYWSSRRQCYETQFQMGYQGLLDLCYRTGQYKNITARIVYEGDIFDFSYGFDNNLIHKPQGKSDKPVFVYGLYETKNGARQFEVMSWKEVMEFKTKYSKAASGGKSSPWDTDPESMAKKTVLKRVLKTAPKSVENGNLVAEAVSGDSGIIRLNEHSKNEIIKDIDYTPDFSAEKPVPEENTAPDKNNGTDSFPGEEIPDEEYAGAEAAFDGIPDGLF